MSRTVDLTPTWAGLLPVLVELAHEGNGTARPLARQELERMAQAADRWNARMALVERYNTALNLKEITPNGDDYNELMSLLDGGAYVEPEEAGR
ncbi:hypothetical protein [Caulobacter vibrioides]|uniref:Uncharacterized protein n=1 Tax=Caulobacter phage S2B TaxID=2759120 RepID=A0AAE7SXJ4_9CAUD|nr:hypothetical protein [Caulobacter vibrioides]QOC54175.1 hypothetical protein [Caulobacter phage S2B]QXZ50209.1 hypothetical protein KZH45_09760 [Caulobacter vibrioides]